MRTPYASGSLLKKILKSRLFVGRSRLSDSWIQENAMGPFERRRSNISRRRLSEPTTAWFWEGWSGREICVQQLFGNAYQWKEIEKRMTHLEHRVYRTIPQRNKMFVNDARFPFTRVRFVSCVVWDVFFLLFAYAVRITFCVQLDFYA